MQGRGQAWMVASRNRPEGGRQIPFGLGILMLLLLTSEVGQGDLAAVAARQPIVDRSQKAAFASPFGTIHEAKFSPAQQPLGASVPLPLDYQLVGFDPNNAGSVRERFLGEEKFFASPYSGPMVDRSRKGDYGVARDRLIALKGDRIKPARPVDAIPQEDGPSLAQQQGGALPAVDAPLGVAAAASEPKEPGSVGPAEVGAQAEQVFGARPRTVGRGASLFQRRSDGAKARHH